MSEISILAIDLAKNSFQVCGVRYRAVSRARRVRLPADQPPCVVAMEACAPWHHWGRHYQPATRLEHLRGLLSSRRPDPPLRYLRHFLLPSPWVAEAWRE